MELKEHIHYYVNQNKGGTYPAFLGREEVLKVWAFHRAIDEYAVTPLVSLPALAEKLGISKVYVKDESKRFGLNAFKALGGTYAVARLICEKLGISIQNTNFEYFLRPEIQEKIKDMVFVTATDGNHGRGLAWAVNNLGCKSVVYMPKGSSETRLQAIIDAGAKAEISDLNYDDAVRLANDNAKKYGWHVVQDTAWEGYEEIPNWITQGYTTMAEEAIEQLEQDGTHRPTHVFLQAGVGSMAGAVLGYYANIYGENCPNTIIVEPQAADCIYQSARTGEGTPKFVDGDLSTIMAGLACGEPNPITWNILRDFSSAFISCPDYTAARGMRILSSPFGTDARIVSGESGAVGIGILSLIMGKEALAPLRQALQLDETSIVLCFSTEGDTDPEHYRQVIYDGKNPSV